MAVLRQGGGVMVMVPHCPCVKLITLHTLHYITLHYITLHTAVLHTAATLTSLGTGNQQLGRMIRWLASLNHLSVIDRTSQQL